MLFHNGGLVLKRELVVADSMEQLFNIAQNVDIISLEALVFSMFSLLVIELFTAEVCRRGERSYLP